MNVLHYTIIERYPLCGSGMLKNCSYIWAIVNNCERVAGAGLGHGRVHTLLARSLNHMKLQTVTRSHGFSLDNGHP